MDRNLWFNSCIPPSSRHHYGNHRRQRIIPFERSIRPTRQWHTGIWTSRKMIMIDIDCHRLSYVNRKVVFP